MLDQSGSVLIEALVSGMLLVIVSVGVLGGFESANRSSSEERHRARAQSIAQEDLARMRAMSISALSSLGTQTRSVPEDGTPYTVKSETEYLTDTTSTPNCTPGTSSADYLRITSTVTWPTIGSRPAVTASSLVAPPAGSISPNSGALAVSVQDASGVGTPGIGIAGSGPGSFSGSTGPTGCIIFGNLPAGSYTVNLTGASSMVDTQGDPPSPKTTSVVAESTNTAVFQYDDPGTAPVQFTTRGYANTIVPSTADGVAVFNTGMQLAGNTRFFTNATEVSQISATGLFPFTSNYTVYAGRCLGNNPTAAAPTAPAAAGAAMVPAGATAPTTTVQLPAMLVNVYTGTTTATTKASGAIVRFTDTSTGCGNWARSNTTNASGQLPDPGLPYGTYTVCASNGARRVQTTALANKVTTAGNPSTAASGTGWATTGSGLNIFLGSGTATTAACP